MGRATLPYSGWSTRFIDYDNDGWKDIFRCAGPCHGQHRGHLSRALGISSHPFSAAEPTRGRFEAGRWPALLCRLSGLDAARHLAISMAMVTSNRVDQRRSRRHTFCATKAAIETPGIAVENAGDEVESRWHRVPLGG